MAQLLLVGAGCSDQELGVSCSSAAAGAAAAAFYSTAPVLWAQLHLLHVESGGAPCWRQRQPSLQADCTLLQRLLCSGATIHAPSSHIHVWMC